MISNRTEILLRRNFADIKLKEILKQFKRIKVNIKADQFWEQELTSLIAWCCIECNDIFFYEESFVFVGHLKNIDVNWLLYKIHRYNNIRLERSWRILSLNRFTEEERARHCIWAGSTGRWYWAVINKKVNTSQISKRQLSWQDKPEKSVFLKETPQRFRNSQHSYAWVLRIPKQC